jgi:hypothetical protein
VHIFLTENNFHTIKKKTQSTKTTNNYWKLFNNAT